MHFILHFLYSFAFKNVSMVLAFRAQNNRKPDLLIFDKKVKGIVYSDKSTVSIFMYDKKCD